MPGYFRGATVSGRQLLTLRANTWHLPVSDPMCRVLSIRNWTPLIFHGYISTTQTDIQVLPMPYGISEGRAYLWPPNTGTFV
jgi:hypothetical protein